MQSTSTRKGMNRGIIIGVIVIVLVIAGAFAYYQSNAPSGTSQVKTETINIDIKAITQDGQEHHIFDPATITVHKGDHIVLIVRNTDNQDTHGIVISELNLNTGPLTSGQQAKLEFDANTTGTFSMRCSVPGCAPDHDQMVGQLIVTE